MSVERDNQVTRQELGLRDRVEQEQIERTNGDLRLESSCGRRTGDLLRPSNRCYDPCFELYLECQQRQRQCERDCQRSCRELVYSQFQGQSQCGGGCGDMCFQRPRPRPYIDYDYCQDRDRCQGGCGGNMCYQRPRSYPCSRSSYQGNCRPYGGCPRPRSCRRDCNTFC